MSRRSRRRRDQRDPVVIANRSPTRLPDLIVSPTIADLRLLSVLREPLVEIEDRRTFHPAGDYRPPLFTVGGLDANRVERKGAKSSKLLHTRFGNLGTLGRDYQSFKVPEVLAVCIRRKRRKEVLHALRKVGRGRGTRRARRRNYLSDVRC